MAKTQKKYRAGFLIVLAIFFAGCATSPREGDVMEILALISAGDVPALMAASRSPFLLDGEILEGEAMRRLFWEGVGASDFAFSDPRVIEVRRIKPGDAALFGDSFELGVFFSKYLTRRDRLVHFASGSSEAWLVLGPGKPRQIVAWTGGA
jgi:hypothetical protein